MLLFLESRGLFDWTMLQHSFLESCGIPTCRDCYFLPLSPVSIRLSDKPRASERLLLLNQSKNEFMVPMIVFVDCYTLWPKLTIAQIAELWIYLWRWSVKVSHGVLIPTFRSNPKIYQFPLGFQVEGEPWHYLFFFEYPKFVCYISSRYIEPFVVMFGLSGSSNSGHRRRLATNGTSEIGCSNPRYAESGMQSSVDAWFIRLVSYLSNVIHYQTERAWYSSTLDIIVCYPEYRRRINRSRRPSEFTIST